MPHTLSKAEYAKLQKKWYDKLADEGFKDLEWVDPATGGGHNSPYLRGSLNGGKPYHAGRELYYQLASNYYVHCKNLKNRPQQRYMWLLHSEGHTYDDIVAALRKKYGEGPSVYTVFYQLQHLAKLCYKWNLTNKHGLLVKRAEDKQAFENSALAEFVAAEFGSEYNWVLSGAVPGSGE